MPKIKEVYEYNNGSWANGTPIGADASNVDVALSDSTSTKDLQSVLGNVSVSDPSMKTQLTGKVNASGGDIKDTVVSVLDPASETDTSEDIDGTDVVVAAGESQTTMWSKFNMFRKRVSNKFSNFLISSVEDVLEPSDTKTYSQAALNSYFADVIGYKTDADVATVGSVADQLSTLNNKISLDLDNIIISPTPNNTITNDWIHLANTNVMHFDGGMLTIIPCRNSSMILTLWQVAFVLTQARTSPVLAIYHDNIWYRPVPNMPSTLSGSYSGALRYVGFVEPSPGGHYYLSGLSQSFIANSTHVLIGWLFFQPE